MIVTATGLTLRLLGGVQLVVDGVPGGSGADDELQGA